MNRQEWHGRRSRKPPRFPWWWILLLIIFSVLLVAGLIQMVSRWAQDSSTRRIDAELRDVYHGGEEFPTLTPIPSAAESGENGSASGRPADSHGAEQAQLVADAPTDAAEVSAEFTASPSPRPIQLAADAPTDAAEASAASTDSPSPGPVQLVTAAPSDAADASTAPANTPVPRLGMVTYAPDRDPAASARFSALRKENPDIVGWLTIGSMIDTPVVQRDNVFYMDHDAKQNENVNGAVFLDEFVSMKSRTRPAGLILYGHNMRTGAMFGSLRNYDSLSFYHNYPFLSFDTVHEDGRYVIFAVGTVNVGRSTAENYLDFFSLTGRSVQERERAIEVLRAVSVRSCMVDVRPDDQLLLLVTCVSNDDERRVVAARRIREGETEAELKRAAGQSQ